MKKITVAFCLLLPILTNAQLYITSGAEIYLSSGENLFVAETFANAGKLIIGPGATAILNGGSASGSGTIKGSSSSNLIIGGTSTSGTYYFDQTTPGTTNVLKDLTINGTAAATLGNAINITGGNPHGIVTVSAGTTLTTGGFLTLKSNINGTSCVAPSYGTISGNLTVERYIPANGRKFRYLASPVVSGSTYQWRDNAGSTSGRGIQITGAGSVDVSTNNDPSAYTYAETNTTDGNDINAYSKWPSIDGNTLLTNGKGYRVFVRGDRSTTDNTTNNATTIWVNGSYPANPVTLPTTYTASAAQGWNLVGNPYPCTIDWDLVNTQSSINYSNINNAIYVWHPLNTTYASGGYASYVAGIGSGTSNIGTRYISSSQAFFVKANGSSPILNIGENHKVIDQQGSRIFKTTDEPSHLRVKLFNENVQFDDAVIHFTEGATKNFDGKFDAYDMTAGIGFLTADLKDTLSISGFPILQDNDIAKINLYKQATGKYKFLFTDLNTLDYNFEPYLIDKFLNTNTLIKDNDVYNFEINENNIFTFGNKRFEIVFAKIKTSANNILNRNNETKISVYPNPATDVLNINLSNANLKNSHLYITNVSGQQLLNTSMFGADAQINIESLSNGVYFVTLTNQNGFNQTVKFVK